MQVKDIMVEPLHIDKAQTLSNAMDMMEKTGMRRLLVTHNGNILGFITMRNIARELGTRKKASLPASSLHVTSATTNNFTKVLPEMKLTEAITIIDKMRGVLVVTGDSNTIGWITPNEILENSKLLDGIAEDAMIRKPITVNPSNRVSHARRLILDKDIGRLPVMEEEKLIGIITEKDIAKAMRAFRELVSSNQQDSRIRNLIVEDIMTRRVTTVGTNTSLREVVTTMLEQNIGGIPVMNDQELVGIITRRNIIKMLAEKPFS
ncbi:MAG: CBS domain-containing protein [Methanosarcinales archaeon]|nr:MAG: CBS domain-containing protein [Methanosarcinales archaeon]